MRDATLEEQQVIQENIDKISKPTGINFNDYLKQALEADQVLGNYYNVIRKNCFSCLYRHNCCVYPTPTNECEYWKLGKCYTCKHYDDATENMDAWFARGCEAWCNGGCEKYKRSWKKTFKWFRFLRQVR